jgi:3-methyladenine DNA glycosylase AlkD
MIRSAESLKTADVSVRALVTGLDARVALLLNPATAAVRAVRRAVSLELRDVPPATVLAFADALIARDGDYDRFFAYEFVAAHRQSMAALTAVALKRLGRDIDSWVDVDTFACFVAGPAWREGQVSDAEIARWARSPNRWWRRAAVVCTVALNNRARGGSGDAKRTLALCTMALDDRDDMVVKAVSWALRELAKRDAAVVERFMSEHDERLAPRVRREVRTKLRTGLKSARRA